MKDEQLTLTSNNGTVLAAFYNESSMNVEPCVSASYGVTLYSPLVC